MSAAQEQVMRIMMEKIMLKMNILLQANVALFSCKAILDLYKEDRGELKKDLISLHTEHCHWFSPMHNVSPCDTIFSLINVLCLC